jgi:hypothetical protein
LHKSKQDEREETDEEAGSTGKLLAIIWKFLPEKTAAIKRILNDLGFDINKRNLKPITPSKHTNGTDRVIALWHKIKVDLSNVPYSKFVEVLDDGELERRLNIEILYLHDIDLTQEFGGVICKSEVINHLISEHRFRMEGDKDGNANERPTMLVNSNSVSDNCLSFIATHNDITTRYKSYNKFVQSCESSNVPSKVGNYLADWVNNPEGALQVAIPKSLDKGFLRLEITL